MQSKSAEIDITFSVIRAKVGYFEQNTVTARRGRGVEASVQIKRNGRCRQSSKRASFVRMGAPVKKRFESKKSPSFPFKILPSQQNISQPIG